MAIQKLKDAQSTIFAYERRHFRQSGVIAMPTYGVPAVDNPKYANGATDAQGTAAVTYPCVLVRLHAPIEEEVVAWTAVKEGAAPLVPNPYLFNPNAVFKMGRRSAAVPMSSMGYPGNSWSMSGEYHYILIRPVDLNSSMAIGVTPFEGQIAVEDSFVPNVNFINSLLEKTPSGYIPPLMDPIGK